MGTKETTPAKGLPVQMAVQLTDEQFRQLFGSIRELNERFNELTGANASFEADQIATENKTEERNGNFMASLGSYFKGNRNNLSVNKISFDTFRLTSSPPPTTPIASTADVQAGPSIMKKSDGGVAALATETLAGQMPAGQ
ncbi:MAG TPA: hypothetical protein VFZ78_12500 [Flavisolibacter sp.]